MPYTAKADAAALCTIPQTGLLAMPAVSPQILVSGDTTMPDIKISRGYCNECSQNVMALAEVPNNLSWLVASLVTGGVGLIFWAIESFEPIVWRCSQCGTEQFRER